ncbi:hypothetical protein U1Q18_042116, partial [Sarracenia purpurea var. burkii]
MKDTLVVNWARSYQLRRWKASGACYECGQIEHLKRDCPKLQRNSAITGPGPSSSTQKSVNKPGVAKKEGQRQGR